MKIRKKNNGKYFIDFTYKGQRIRRVIGDSKREAEDAMISIRGDIIKGKYGLPKRGKNIMFVEHSKDYLKLYAQQNKKSWARDQISINHLTAFFKTFTLSNITSDLIEKYKAKRREKVSPATVNRELSCLKSMFSKAVEWERIEDNLMKKVKLFKENNVKERILDTDEIKSLIAGASPHLKPILILALNTGMRRNEILSLKWQNINIKQGYILIEISKSGRSRKVPMNTLVLETLGNFNRDNEYLFYNPRTKTHIKSIKTAFKTACRNAGITNLRLHDLRHTAATKMIEAGIDLVTVSRILGHSSIQMTMRYAHPTPENMQRAVDKLSELFNESRHKVDTHDKPSSFFNPTTSLFPYN